MASLKILKNPGDVNWPELHALVRNAFAYMDDRINPPSSVHRMTPEDFEQKARDETLLVLRQDGKLIACMFCRPEKNWLYVGKVAVAEHARGQGIARALFERAFQIAQDLQLEGLELETRVELIENHETFRRLGFEVIGEKSHAGFGRPTSITMRATGLKD